MRDGRKTCVYCFSRFEFLDYELVDSMPAEDPCPGCVTLYAILEQSAMQLASSPRLRAEKDAALGRNTNQQDLSPSAILARLLENRRRAQEPQPFDARMAAAGDRD